ncbi:MAG: thioredoxin family protein [Candidatus Micrarchaeia archaeon]
MEHTKKLSKRLEPGKVPKTYLVAGIIIIIILLLVSIYLFVQSISNSISKANEHITEFDEGLDTNATGDGQKAVQSVEECFKTMGFESVLVYMYLPTCPYCQQMNPIIDNLISRGYPIAKVDASNTKLYVNLAGCTNMRAVVPQYICTLNGKVLEGSVSEDELMKFYNSCQPPE